jgi:AcrR family transcriptional regulator
MARTVEKTDLRKKNGDERRARTRALILSAAFDVLGDEQGRLVRIEQVAEAARVARPTFYTYFSSLEELFGTLSYELNREFNVAVLESARSLADAAEEVANAVRYYLRKAREDNRWGWSMVNLSLVGPVFGAEATNAAEDSIRSGMSSGVFKVVDMRIGRDMVLGVALLAMKTMLAEKTPAAYPEQVTRQLLIGLGVPTAKAERLVAKALPKLDKQERAGM